MLIIFVIVEIVVYINDRNEIKKTKKIKLDKKIMPSTYIYKTVTLKCLLHSVTAFDYSGGYFNPVLATSLKAGCEGHTMLEHAMVYWIGACAGSVLSVYMYKLPAVQRFIKGPSEANGDSIWADKED